MKSVFFEGLTPLQSAALRDLLPELPFSVSDDGTPVDVRPGERLSLSRRGSRIEITYSRPVEFYRALSMLGNFLSGKEETLEQTRVTRMLCYMADLSRNAVFSVKGAKEMLRLLALCGYDSMMLYTEETYEIPGYPTFGYQRGRYSAAELKELDDYAFALGIELIPCIQTLAHLASALRWNAAAPVRDTEDILLVGEEKTYELIDAMLSVCETCFRSRRINIGMDEAHRLGQGKYLDRNGYRKKSDIMLEHLSRVAQICDRHGFAPMMWSDMFFRMQFHGVYRMKEGEVLPEVTALVPKNVSLIYWDYYTLDRELFTHMVQCHKKFDNPIVFAGGASKWYGFAPLNAFSVESTRLQLDVCAEYGIDQIIVTGWGDHGAEASEFSILPSLLYYAERAYRTGEPTAEELERRSSECFGAGYADLMLTDVPNDMGPAYYTKETIINPCKYLLYNDPINGLTDANMDPATVADCFRRNAQKLLPMTKHPRWGYLFETLYRLCDLLTEKSDLSVRIRRAYLDGKRETLEKIAKEEIPATVTKLDAFTDAYRRQWFRENKPYGFDIQENRLGGLRLRLLSAAARIRDYLAGETESIDELEEERLDVFPHKEDNPYCMLNKYAEIVSANKDTL